MATAGAVVVPDAALGARARKGGHLFSDGGLEGQPPLEGGKVTARDPEGEREVGEGEGEAQVLEVLGVHAPVPSTTGSLVRRGERDARGERVVRGEGWDEGGTGGGRKEGGGEVNPV